MTESTRWNNSRPPDWVRSIQPNANTGLAARDGGWTFVETIVSITIVLILTSSVGFVTVRYIGRARIAASRSQIQTYALALNTYLLDAQRFPTNEQGLDALWEKPILQPVPSGWDGPYLDGPVENDAWGNSYRYSAPGPNGLPFEIVSLGSDGVEGGEGSAADIHSWDL